jgi:hypothetical protein
VTTRSSGVTKANVALAASRLKRLGNTLFQNILDAEQSRLYSETRPLRLNAKQLSLIRAVLEKRAKTFLAALESEFETRSAPGLDGETKRMGVSVYSWEEE